MVDKRKKICVFSGKRGGFGAYIPLMQEIENDPDLDLQILLADMHTSKEFGNTAKEAREFFSKATIRVVKMGTGRGDSPRMRVENLGVLLKETPKILEDLGTDVVFVHGDRGEHLMVAEAALNLNIPVAHTQGGDVSGNIDEIQRHAITKLSHIHFPETKQAAQRIEKLGEEKWRIHVVGSTYIDRIKRRMYTPEKSAREKYGIGESDYGIILFHPETFASKERNCKWMRNVLSASKSFDMKYFVVYPCSDPGYEGVISAIKGIKNDEQFMIHKNIHNLDFLGLMEGASVLLGNSSSALVEAPYFQLPAVNVGKRQVGREREKNVVDATYSVSDIKRKIQHVLTNKAFKSTLKKCGYRLGDGNTGKKIVKILRKLPINDRLIQKRITY